MDKKFTIFVVALCVILLGIVVFYFSASKPAASLVSSSAYSLDSKERPSAEVKNTSASLGGMKVSDERSADFLIKNVGTKPLQITGMRSSCMCTVGKLIYNGTESQEFGMHAQESVIVGEIAPSSQATVRVTYRPFLMPVYGAIEREVYVQTNDPQNPQLILKVTANVK